MILKDIINKSYYGTIGYISKKEDILLLERYILFNLKVLQEYKNIIIATNYSNIELAKENNKIWKKYFPNCITLDCKINRGHSFGTADLDNLIFDYCKENNIQWLCKGANDVIIETSILDLSISEADFYYLNSIGYGGMEKYEYDFDKIIKEDFFPQTNFYFINVSKVDYLNDKNYLNETYEYISSLSNYNGKIWEYVSGWTCERFLKQCVERNNLSIDSLIPHSVYRKLLEMVYNYKIHDCSHKNILINGICHFQHPNEKIIKI